MLWVELVFELWGQVEVVLEEQPYIVPVVVEEIVVVIVVENIVDLMVVSDPVFDIAVGTFVVAVAEVGLFQQEQGAPVGLLHMFGFVVWIFSV